VSRRGAGAALALTGVCLAATLAACGEKEERVVGPSRAEVRALVASGLDSVGSAAAPPGLRVRAGGGVLSVWMASLPGDGPLETLGIPFERIGVRIVPFCPKPALLHCRPSFRAWASPSSRRAMKTAVRALRRLAAVTYDSRLLVRRRGQVTRIVTPNGELLAAFRALDGQVAMSFGGPSAPRPPLKLPRAGALRLEAGEAALEAMRRDLPRLARRATLGFRQLRVEAPLQG
jgi:hypothetical protein